MHAYKNKSSKTRLKGEEEIQPGVKSNPSQLLEQILKSTVGMFPSKMTQVTNHTPGLKIKFWPLNPSSLKNY